MGDSPRDKKICEILCQETDGKSYKAHKYSLDTTQRPAIDYGDDELVWKKRAESLEYTKHRNLKEDADDINRRGNQVLTYFLDGSRRVFKVDDQAYHDGKRSLIYPIVAGQIAVGCCKRLDKKIYHEKFKQEFVISVPRVASASGRTGFFEAITQNLNDCQLLKRLGVQFGAVLPYNTSADGDKKVDFVDRGTAKIQDRMIESEKKLVEELVREGKLNQDNFLVKDGSLEYRLTDKEKKDGKARKTFKNNYEFVLGVSKSFNPEACIDSTKKPNPAFIADLPLYHRTPVACFENQRTLGDVQFAVWYVRIREQAKTRTPFDGILKIEKILASPDEMIDSELVDFLTAHIINERMPTCYGSDLRWANHLYPIFLTESFVKSKYLSTESFLNMF